MPALEDTLLPSEKGDVLEWAELWSFAGAKANPCWLWVALCRRTRQIVACTLGERTQESAFFLREAIPAGYARRATRSDFWEPYEMVSPAARTAAATRLRAKPTMSSVGLAPCEQE